MSGNDIVRIYNFTAGTPAVADQVDAEFDQIIPILNSKPAATLNETITGSWSFAGGLTTSTATVTGALTAASVSTAGTLSVGGVASFSEKITAAKGIKVTVSTVPVSPTTGDIWGFNNLLYTRGASQTFPIIISNGMAGAIVCGLKPTQTSGNIFQFAPGVIISSDGTDSIVFNTAVNVDISVTSGTGYRNPSETRTANTQYYVWAMRNPTTNTNILVWSNNRTTAPTISGFTLSALIPEFAAFNNASNTFENHLIEQWQNGTRIRFDIPYNTFDPTAILYRSGSFTGTSWNNVNYGTTSSIAKIIPPIANWAFINGYSDTAGSTAILARKTSSSPEFGFVVGGANLWPFSPQWIPIAGSSSTQFQVRCNAVSDQAQIFPMGWGV